MTEQVANLDELRARVAAWRDAGRRVGFVPTMGNLHDGHLALVRRAAELADRVVASIFVNPTQFGPGEDFEDYPRTLDADLTALAGTPCDLVFTPPVATMYPYGPEGAVRVSVPAITEILEGARRPGHFDGVATVVTRLFQMVAPDVAVFGRKDYQQLAVIRRLTVDLAMPVTIDGVPTVREADGLAMSSRNAYLSDEERRRAPALYQTLREAGSRLAAGERDFGAIERDGEAALERAGFEPEYLAVRRPGLEPPAAGDVEFVVLAAARLGRARLIDNIAVGSGGPTGGRPGNSGPPGD